MEKENKKIKEKIKEVKSSDKYYTNECNENKKENCEALQESLEYDIFLDMHPNFLLIEIAKNIGKKMKSKLGPYQLKNNYYKDGTIEIQFNTILIKLGIDIGLLLSIIQEAWADFSPMDYFTSQIVDPKVEIDVNIKASKGGYKNE